MRNLRSSLQGDRLPNSVSRRGVLTGIGGLLSIGSAWMLSPLFDSDDLPEDRPVVVGHRGAAGLEPENTIASLRRALEIGVDAIEVDVRQTRDGRLILFHDPVLDWSTTGNGWVTNTDWADVREVRFDGEPIPTLEEGLDLLAGAGVDVYLELKEEGYTTDALEAIERFGLLDRTTFVAFSTAILEPIADEPVPTGMLTSVPNPVTIDEASDLDSSVTMCHYTPRGADWFVDRAREAGLTAGIWKLVDTRGSVRDMLELNPDLVVTNRPDYVWDVLEEG